MSTATEEHGGKHKFVEVDEMFENLLKGLRERNLADMVNIWSFPIMAWLLHPPND